MGDILKYNCSKSAVQGSGISSFTLRLLFIFRCSCNNLPPQLHILLSLGSSLGFGVALLLVYFNKAVGVSTSGQQQSAKIRMWIT